MLELIALPFIVLGLLAATVGGVRYAHHVRYQRCLANIERLEIELGYGLPARLLADDRYTMSAAQVQAAWRRGLLVDRDDSRAVKANRRYLVNAYKRER